METQRLTGQTTYGRIAPLKALKAIGALARNPDDTAQVFTIIEALSGKTPERLRRRFQADANGARLLRERPDLVALLSDREALRRLPEGSLGRAYLAFVESEGISADGLIAASESGETGDRVLPQELEFIHARMRDTHDLWHALTGYQGDTVGEAALLAFLSAQTRNPAIVMIVMMSLVRATTNASRRTILDGFRRGWKAAWLPALDWEALLSRPVAEVREELHIEEPASYRPVRTAELRAQGLLA